MPHSNSLCYEFGPFQLDVRERVLTRDGRVVSLTPKAMDILLVLLKNAGELVDKETLMTEVWPNSFVEEANLSQNVFKLRLALGDQRSGAQYVETVPRRGYRFVASVTMGQGAPGVKSAHVGSVAHGAVDGATKVAVLTFLNATGNENLAYLSDGMTDNITNSLAQISRLRVLSRSAMLRFKGREIDPKLFAQETRVDAMLFGKITSQPFGFIVSAELVDGRNGWQLWGKSFECELSGVVEIQDEIVRHISAALKLTLTGDEERRIAARYTDCSEAYQAYLEGRFHWSRYTRNGIELAIEHFRRAIDLDPNYVLAYSGVIDCYLRLVTNYLPPDLHTSSDSPSRPLTKADPSGAGDSPGFSEVSDPRVRLRHEWDWKGAERELRRANDLKSDYPAPHQWHAAFLYVRQLYLNLTVQGVQQQPTISTHPLTDQIGSFTLTHSEEVQVYCAIAREQIVVGNFEGARLVLERWLPQVGWPKLAHLDPHVAADLLLTLGNLIAALSLTGRIAKGNKRAEAYLSGSIALFEQLGRKVAVAESQIELARCFYREGLFDDAKEMLTLALEALPSDQTELISLCLSIYGCVERDSGQLWESLDRLRTASLMETGQLVTGFRHLQLATTLKELGNSELNDEYYREASQHFQSALYEFEAIGNHRHTAATENNYGYLLLSIGRYQECELHLHRALDLFTNFSDQVRAAQVNETLAQLFLTLNDFSRAQQSVDIAIATLEKTEGTAILAEALTTKGIVACRLSRFEEAKTCFEVGNRMAEQSGDSYNAGRALLTLSEEMGNRLEEYERQELIVRLKRFLSQTKHASLKRRMACAVRSLESS